MKYVVYYPDPDVVVGTLETTSVTFTAINKGKGVWT